MTAWLPVVGYEGLYEVSSDGRVRSLARFAPTSRGNGLRPVKARELTLSPIANASKAPYAHVSLTKDGITRSRAVHRLVLHAFSGPRPEGMVGRHLNSASLDNRAENLAWGTPKQNMADRDEAGRGPQGTRNPRCALTPHQVLEVRASSDTALVLAAKYSVTRESIYNIRKGATWAHL